MSPSLSLTNVCGLSVVPSCINKAPEFMVVGPCSQIKPNRSVKNIRWIPPSPNWFKLNTDGSSLGNSGVVRGFGSRTTSDIWGFFKYACLSESISDCP